MLDCALLHLREKLIALFLRGAVDEVKHLLRSFCRLFETAKFPLAFDLRMDEPTKYELALERRVSTKRVYQRIETSQEL